MTYKIITHNGKPVDLCQIDQGIFYNGVPDLFHKDVTMEDWKHINEVMKVDDEEKYSKIIENLEKCEMVECSLLLKDPLTGNTIYEFQFEILEMEDRIKKAPIGLTPKKIRDDQRRTEIIEAIARYSKARKKVPVNWIEEFKELLNKLPE